MSKYTKVRDRKNECYVCGAGGSLVPSHFAGKVSGKKLCMKCFEELYGRQMREVSREETNRVYQHERGHY